MPSDSESRVRDALRADVAEVPFLVTEDMVQERIADRRSPLSRLPLALGSVAVFVVATWFVVAQVALNPGPSAPIAGTNVSVEEPLPFAAVTPAPGPPQRLELPTGTFQAARPFDGTCVAIQVTDPGRTPIAAVWWDAGNSDDCTTRSSEIVPSVAELEAPLLRVPLQSAAGEVRELTFRFTGATEDEIRFARRDEFEVSFRRIEP